MHTHALRWRVVGSSLFIALILTLVATGAFAQEYLDYADYIHQVGQCQVRGEPLQLYVEGDLAYIHCRDEGVDIVDIGDPEHPVKISSMGNEMVNYVSAHGDLAYMSWALGVKIMNMSTPNSPIQVGAINAENSGHCSRRIGDYLYIYIWDIGLCVYDVSDPAAPGFVSMLNDIPLFLDIAVVDDLAFLACRGEGVKILDISDLSAPVLLSTLSTDNWSNAIDVAGSTMLIAESRSGISRLRIADIANPALPTVVGTVNLPGAFPNPYQNDVCHVGDTAFIAARHDGEIMTVDFSDPAAPTIIGDHPVRISAVRLAARDGFVIVSSGTDRPWDPVSYVTCLDIGDGQYPPAAESMMLDDAVSAMATSGAMAYVGLGSEGLAVLDTHGSGAPALLGRIAVPGTISDIDVADGLAYLSAGSAGIVVVDISDPDLPVQVGIIAVQNGAKRLALADNVVYVAGGNQFHILDVTDLSEPVELGSYQCEYQIGDIACHDSAVYLASLTEWSDVIDVSDPAHPVHLGPTGAWSCRGKMLVKDDLLLFSGDWHGSASDMAAVYAISVSDPLDPDVVDSFNLNGDENTALTMFGDYAYINAQGVHVIDFSDPGDLGSVGYLQENPGILAATSCRLLMGGFADMPERLAWMPLQSDGITPVEEIATPTIARLRSYPNPFNPITMISFELPTPGRANLNIYDTSGRCVRHLLDAPLAAGPHERSWDGRDDGGSHLASGVYLARFVCGETVAQSKLLMLK
ncbi:MAG: T9SS type A sorting domain-containing protein [bacterium]|nr:T9SS type A sorting domain-containing protein [bacterium]